jgi:hypothetical protein
MEHDRHSFLKESAVAGLIGAGVVAIWFLLLDLIGRYPFATPSLLGQVLLFGRTDPVVTEPVWPAVAAYTAAHVAAFWLFGMLATRLVVLAARSMLALFALFVLVVTFEVFFYGIVLMFLAGTEGVFPAWEVFVANTLALIAMGAYLLPRHPEVRRRLAKQPLGA